MHQQRFFVGLCVIAALLAAIVVPLVSQRHDDFGVERAALRWEATLFLPVNDHAGTPFPPDVWNKAMEQIVGPFGGATVYEPKEGYWKGAAGIIHEPVRPVVVTFEVSRRPEFRTALTEIGRILGQDSVYARMEKCQVELIAVQPAKRGG